MDAVIEELRYLLERSDKDIERCHEEVQYAKRRLAEDQGRLDRTVIEYNQAVNFKAEAIVALAILEAYEEE